MKKIILKIVFISILFIITNKVNANTYYTEWTSEKLINNIYEIQTITKYKFYQENIIGEYVQKGNAKYPYFDQEKIIYGEYSEHKEKCDENNDVKYSNIYPYRVLKDINYVKIYNQSRNTIINNIDIYNLDKKVEYSILESSNYENNIINTDGYILLKLNDKIEYNQFNIIFSSKEPSSIISYVLYDHDKNLLLDTTILLGSTNNQPLISNIPLTNYTNILYSNEEIIKDSNNLIYKPILKCQERSIAIYNYDIEKVYYDDNYHINVDGYIKDLNNYNVYYRYVINEDQLITNKLKNYKKELDDINNKTINNFNNIKKELDNINNETINNFNNIKEEFKNINNTIDQLVINNKKESILSSNKENTNSLINVLKLNNITFKYILIAIIILIILFIIWRKKSHE